MPTRPSSTPPPAFSLPPPSSPIFLSLHNWIMGGRGGSIVHCFGFPWFKSSSQSGWEGTRGSQQAPLGCEGSCWSSEWAEGTERPWVMRWHEIQQATVHSPPSWGRLFFLKVEAPFMVFFILSTIRFGSMSYVCVCVFLCAARSVEWGPCFKARTLRQQLDRHA